MTASREGIVVTTLRLPQARHTQLRLEVVRRGTSIQKALEQALEAWLQAVPSQPAKPLRGLRLRGILRGAKVFEIRERERRRELAREGKRL